MPNWFQRRWLSCTAVGLLTLWATRWVWRHSPAGGSDDIVRWSKAAWTATQQSVQAHIVHPLRTVHDELTRTFRDRPSIVSQQEFDADKQSLMRMLGDFEKDVSKHPATAGSSGSKSSASASKGGGGGAGGGAGKGVPDPFNEGVTEEEQATLLRGMQLVMASYESELRDPVRNLLMGQLARSLLIQVQRLKLDTEAAMLEMDQILKANELSISLVAAIPALALTWGTLSTLARWLMPHAPDAQHAAVPCRMALTSLERALHHLADQETALTAETAAGGGVPTGATAGAMMPAGAVNRFSGSPVGTSARLASGAVGGESWLAVAAVPGGVMGWLDAEGMVVFAMNQLYREALALFLTADTRSRHSEWPSLSADLAELTAAAGAWPRLRVLDRMARSYQVFKR